MFVDYETYSEIALSEIDSEQYSRLAPVADAIVDAWTLERAGRAVGRGLSLPQQVVHLYAAVVDALPSVLEQTKAPSLVSSFSNGVDSFSFDAPKTLQEQLYGQLGWMVNLLPVEWVSGVSSYEGGLQ